MAKPYRPETAVVGCRLPVDTIRQLPLLCEIDEKRLWFVASAVAGAISR